MTLHTKTDRLAMRKLYIPEGAIKDHRSTDHYEIYRYGSSTHHYALVFTGTSAYPKWHLIFLESGVREDAINRFVEKQEARRKVVAERRDLWKNFKHDISVGDIFHTSWGFEQTNVEFMQVVRVVTPKTVEVREIKRTVTEYAAGGMSGGAIPHQDEFTSGVKRCRAKPSREGKTYLVSPLHKYSHGYRWDGQSVFCSWYG